LPDKSPTSKAKLDATPSIQVRSFFKEFFVSKNYVLSDAAMKMAYLSLAVAALVFVSLLILTTLHP
jgi:hypothetical protein